MDDENIKILIGTFKNLIRIGTVSSVNSENGTVRVIFEDKDNVVSGELPLLSNEYNIPDVKDQVLCIFLPNGISSGFCIGSYYSSVNQPPAKDANIYYKKFSDGTSVQYNKVTKELTINSEKQITINGDVKVTGTVTASNITG